MSEHTSGASLIATNQKTRDKVSTSPDWPKNLADGTTTVLIDELGYLA